MPKTQNPAQLRISLPLRALALFLDIGLFAGLSAALVGALDAATSAVLGGKGLSLSSSLISLPLCLLYYFYFATELMMNKTIGKQMLGIEVRSDNGLASSGDAIFKRFVLKHGWVLIFVLSLTLEMSVLGLIAQLWLLGVILSSLSALGKDRQTFYDKVTRLAVFPLNLPRADLTTLSLGQNESELAQLAADQVKNMGTSESVRRRAKDTLRDDHFPCVVELMVYMRSADDPAQLLFECFAKFVPNVHLNQFKISGKKRGDYQKCRAVIRFDNALQMETSYAALAQLPSVVTTTTNDSVKVR
jgi:uncharacterized RDD family membrane protein YckC/putative lipoic acid-binding regulatory protein